MLCMLKFYMKRNLSRTVCSAQLSSASKEKCSQWRERRRGQRARTPTISEKRPIHFSWIFYFINAIEKCNTLYIFSLLNLSFWNRFRYAFEMKNCSRAETVPSSQHADWFFSSVSFFVFLNMFKLLVHLRNSLRLKDIVRWDHSKSRFSPFSHQQSYFIIHILHLGFYWSIIILRTPYFILEAKIYAENVFES